MKRITVSIRIEEKVWKEFKKRVKETLGSHALGYEIDKLLRLYIEEKGIPLSITGYTLTHKAKDQIFEDLKAQIRRYVENGTEYMTKSEIEDLLAKISERILGTPYKDSRTYKSYIQALQRNGTMFIKPHPNNPKLYILTQKAYKTLIEQLKKEKEIIRLPQIK